MSSLVGKAEVDIELNVRAEKFYDIFCNRPDHISDASSKKVQATLRQGNWGSKGSIVVWDYILDGETQVSKEVIEGVDQKTYSITYRVIEGDVLKAYKSFATKLQAIPKSQGEGSIARWTLEYEKLHEGVPSPNILLELFKQLSKEVDSHLLQAN